MPRSTTPAANDGRAIAPQPRASPRQCQAGGGQCRRAARLSPRRGGAAGAEGCGRGGAEVSRRPLGVQRARSRRWRRRAPGRPRRSRRRGCRPASLTYDGAAASGRYEREGETARDRPAPRPWCRPTRRRLADADKALDDGKKFHSIYASIRAEDIQAQAWLRSTDNNFQNNAKLSAAGSQFAHYRESPREGDRRAGLGDAKDVLADLQVAAREFIAEAARHAGGTRTPLRRRARGAAQPRPGRPGCGPGGAAARGGHAAAAYKKQRQASFHAAADARATSPGAIAGALASSCGTAIDAVDRRQHGRRTRPVLLCRPGYRRLRRCGAPAGRDRERPGARRIAAGAPSSPPTRRSRPKRASSLDRILAPNASVWPLGGGGARCVAAALNTAADALPMPAPAAKVPAPEPQPASFDPAPVPPSRRRAAEGGAGPWLRRHRQTSRRPIPQDPAAAESSYALMPKDRRDGGRQTPAAHQARFLATRTAPSSRSPSPRRRRSRDRARRGSPPEVIVALAKPGRTGAETPSRFTRGSLQISARRPRAGRRRRRSMPSCTAAAPTDAQLAASSGGEGTGAGRHGSCQRSAHDATAPGAVLKALRLRGDEAPRP